MIKQTYDLEDVFRQYRTKIYWLAFGISRNEKDAEDILQNAFVKIVANIRSFQGRSSLSTWIYRVSYNEALMFLRKKQRQYRLSKYLTEQTVRIPGEMFAPRMKTPQEDAIERELKTRLDDAVQRVPVKYRMPLVLHTLEAMPMKDTAQVMRLKLNSLKTRLHRAYAMLRSEFVPYLADGMDTGRMKYFLAGARSQREAHSPARIRMTDCAVE